MQEWDWEVVARIVRANGQPYAVEPGSVAGLRGPTAGVAAAGFGETGGEE